MGVVCGASGLPASGRAVAAGVQFMHRVPDIRVDPGLELFLTPADWAMDDVFSAMQKTNFGFWEAIQHRHE